MISYKVCINGKFFGNFIATNARRAFSEAEVYYKQLGYGTVVSYTSEYRAWLT